MNFAVHSYQFERLGKNENVQNKIVKNIHSLTEFFLSCLSKTLLLDKLDIPRMRRDR